MSTPFERLRLVIEKIGTEQNAPPERDHPEEIVQEDADVYHCHHYTVSHNKQKTQNKSANKSSTSEFYTKAEIAKVISLYEQQKQKVAALDLQNKNLLAQLRSKNNNIQELNKTYTEKNFQMEATRIKNQEIDNQKYMKAIIQKQKISKKEIEKLNQLLDEINRQLNILRQRYKTLETQSAEQNLKLSQQIQYLNRVIRQKDKQLESLNNEIEERKRIIQFNIQSNLQTLKSKDQQHDLKISQLQTIIRSLKNQINGYNSDIEAHLSKHREHESNYFSYENKIAQISKQSEEAHLFHSNEKQSLISKIQTLVKSLEMYQDVQKRNEELERLIQEEKAKEKYHIVEVKDETLQLEVGLLKGQVKELLKSRAIAQQKLKKSCNCLRTTLLLKDQSSPANTIQYLKGHQIKLLKQ